MFDRRLVMATVASAAGVASIAIAVIGSAAKIWELYALAFAIGDLSAVTYPIAMAHASDHRAP